MIADVGLRILGTGRALPKQAVTADDLDRDHGLAAGSVAQMTGVKTRYRARH